MSEHESDQKLSALDAVPSDLKNLSEKERMELRAKKFGVVDRPKEDDDRRSNNRNNRRKSDYYRDDDLRDQFGRERRPADRRKSEGNDNRNNRKRRRGEDEEDEYDKYNNAGYDDRGKRRKLSNDVEEKREVFKIASMPRESFDYEETHPDLVNSDVDDPSRMSFAGYCPEEDIRALWGQKNRLDDLFDSGQDKIYYQVRDSIFPQDKKGSSRFSNRAGDKLWEVHEAVDLFEGIEKTTFIDLCGGPGAFSQMLLERAPAPSFGYGMTLKVPMTPSSDVWYRQLETDRNFTITYGEDGTGDVYKSTNLEALKTLVEKEEINIFVSDGGFRIRKNEKGEHMENYQELFSGRIVLSEFLAALKTLHTGGHFVCKLFDSFSHLTISLVYLTSQLFKDCYIVKPLRSRIVNSERYLVGKFLKEKDAKFEDVIAVVDKLHQNCEENKSPFSAVPLHYMQGDGTFLEGIKEMITVICNKQTKALKLIMDEIDFKMNKMNFTRTISNDMAAESTNNISASSAPKKEDTMDIEVTESNNNEGMAVDQQKVEIIDV
jgi:cap1 methyltransferase